ncbi:P-loop NTPase [Nannocystis radixulma]|uniref:Aminoglycoside phosphotransferase domain-containing protein n=1 Tax=Nannocystis radixulma TaxID=2995305 RepID=A0ABT5B8T2_9BACT|nr:hypothetical protein [Nannocystis radixulma]MDC0670535.1 hypothetical protein [Nannocystis radixulma]
MALGNFPPEYTRFETLAARALEEWAPAAVLHFTPMRGGFSGAAVLKVDISKAASGGLSGQYIIKLDTPSQWEDVRPEHEGHRAAEDADPEFAREHIPKLVRMYTSDAPDAPGHAMLMNIAGSSLDNYVATDSDADPRFRKIARRAVSEMLRAWVDEEPEGVASPADLLTRWVGYRLDPEKAPRLHALVADVLSDGRNHFQCRGLALPDPLHFRDFLREHGPAERPAFHAFLHGDLHGGNLIAHRSKPESSPYWIIDYGLSGRGFAGYDQAYLEFSHVYYALRDKDPAQLINVLDNLDEDAHALLPGSGQLLHDLLREMRAAEADWLESAVGTRRDDWERQALLARVAVGLCWANKPIGRDNQRLALCYAAWYCRRFLGRCDRATQDNFWASRPAEEATANETDEAAWKELWTRAGGFSPAFARFVLVAERQAEQVELQALGQIPWSVIIDLDPNSDTGGLREQSSSTLEALRSVQIFSEILPEVLNFRRGTVWMMAGGYSLHREPPLGYEEWTWRRKPVIQELFRRMEVEEHLTPIVVVIMPGATLDQDIPAARLTLIAMTIAETTRNRATMILCGSRNLLLPVAGLCRVPIVPKVVVKKINSAYGTQTPSLRAQIPAVDGEFRTVPLTSLRAIEENLTLLHTAVLSALPAEQDSEGYLRGRPPTLLDLHHEIDVRRKVHEQLVKLIRARLKESRNHTIILEHTPGAGGTTAAMRLGWELRNDFPVALLHRYSAALAVRLGNIFHIAEKPVLLIADSSDLTETPRQELYTALLDANVRVVLLYIRHVFSTSAPDPAPPDEHERRDGRAVSIGDPMDLEEAELFRALYSTRTDDRFRKAELRRIATEPALARYRTPFFFGLTTYERDFEGVDRYVRQHLRRVRQKPRELLQFLALVTIYTDRGVDIALIRRLAGLSDSSSLEVPDTFGEGPARLIVLKDSEARIAHSVLAEETMSVLSGGSDGDWRLDLHVIATDFIDDVAEKVDVDAQDVLDMFRQMFTERYRGIVDGVDDKRRFSPLIEDLDQIDRSLAARVFERLTEKFPTEAHFWNHRGRYMVYRMRRDLDKAEEFLLKATALSPDDYVHHHTLGLVRRYRVRELMKALAGSSVEEKLGRIRGLFDASVEAFNESRRINPENIYTYITHAQLILDVARKLRESAGAATVAEIGETPGQWLQEQLCVATELLSTAKRLYGTIETDDHYLEECYSDLRKLYGDIDKVIEIWEIANDRRAPSAAARRALVHAHLARYEDKWSAVPEVVIERLTDLLETNLRSQWRSGADYSLWFEAYRRSKTYNREEALARLRQWAGRFEEWQAWYLTYVLYFTAWFEGATEDILQMKSAIQRSDALVLGRKQFSPLWLGCGVRGASYSLVSDDELGAWDRQKNFWSNDEALLRVNGVIEVINGPQAGNIMISNKVRLFFVPGTEFSKYKDENIEVSFHVGFSPVGLRAWRVRRGWEEGGERTSTAREDQVLLFEPKDPEVDEGERRAQLEKLRSERVHRFVDDLIAAKVNIEAEIYFHELSDRVAAAFGLGEVDMVQRDASIRDYLAQANRYDITDDGVVSLRGSAGRVPLKLRSKGKITYYNRDRAFGFLHGEDGVKYWFHRDSIAEEDRLAISELGRGHVYFWPDTNDRGPCATRIRLQLSPERAHHIEQLSIEEFSACVVDIVRRTLEEYPLPEIDVDALLNLVREEMPTQKSLNERLGTGSFRTFLSQIPDITVYKRGPRWLVSADVQPAPRRRDTQRRTTDDAPVGNAAAKLGDFGGWEEASELLDGHEKKQREPGRMDRTPGLRLDEVVAAATAFVKGKGNSTNLSVLMQHLEKRFPGDARIIDRLGFALTSHFINAIPGLRLNASKRVWLDGSSDDDGE